MSTQNDITKYVFHHRTGYSDSLWQYKNGSLVNTIHIDKTCDAVYWCNRKNMAIRDFVVADDGNVYAIWVGDNELICALPVRNPEVIREVTA